MNKDKLAKTRSRIEEQGFRGMTDQQISDLDLPLRFAPALCMTWAAIATASASAIGFWTLLPFAILGGFLPNHPFDFLYNGGIRRINDGERIPSYNNPRQFACKMASVHLFGAALSIELGYVVLGQIIGGSLVLAAAVTVFSGFCLASFMYNRMPWNRRKSQTTVQTQVTQ